MADTHTVIPVSQETQPPTQGARFERIADALHSALQSLYAERHELDQTHPDADMARVLDHLLWRLDMALRDTKTLQQPGQIAPPIIPTVMLGDRYGRIRRMVYQIDTVALAREAEQLAYDPANDQDEYATLSWEPHPQDQDAAQVMRELIGAVDHALAELVRLERSASATNPVADAVATARHLDD